MFVEKKITLSTIHTPRLAFRLSEPATLHLSGSTDGTAAWVIQWPEMELSAIGSTEDDALKMLSELLDSECAYWLNAVRDDSMKDQIPERAYPYIQKLMRLLQNATPR